ncbi:MAG: 16S rRNA (guanine(527)-N(7))-methyltransferase RsmG [Methylibium sp.]|uniref:16S rRNA (guanine(527)-N(7))-methyltransferase RsmG n=1 Tax=Methylibium sp. TaxID=2067992 RepID=UPI0017C5CBD1|nr:16S rRNA (guanine(527)-N(7))-methyltransferase RsmG [Methylibium sp.]MBA3595798.1 16S rRNA (guanine(527)-N(7))-methyltransferase RsmG [Methylibium sp.]
MTFESQDRLAATLREGLVGLKLDLDGVQQGLLLRHLALIEQWNRVYNLTAVREPAHMLTQHLLDSLAAVRPLRQVVASNGWRGEVSLLDVGSGAGLPGISIAVTCPEWSMTCVDAVGKKAGFIRQVGVELGLRNLAAVHSRVEALVPKPWQVIVSRAFASLASFTASTAPLLAEGGVWLAMKGKVPNQEIAQLPQDIEVFHVEPLEVPGLNAERCIVWMRRTMAAQRV